jgi:hypothetical protein
LVAFSYETRGKVGERIKGFGEYTLCVVDEQGEFKAKFAVKRNK